jgi:hypothetical protein
MHSSSPTACTTSRLALARSWSCGSAGPSPPCRRRSPLLSVSLSLSLLPNHSLPLSLSLSLTVYTSARAAGPAQAPAHRRRPVAAAGPQGLHLQEALTVRPGLDPPGSNDSNSCCLGSRTRIGTAVRRNAHNHVVPGDLGWQWRCLEQNAVDSFSACTR